MATTWWDMGTSPAADSWRRIRKQRAAREFQPRARRELICCALEQSEQQFQAAATVPYESRPLNLFYGLSQAGRAIHAVHSAAGFDGLRGHGITLVNGSGVTPRNFGQLVVRDNGSGAFTTLGQTLASATLPEGAQMSELWACIVEAVLHAPLDERTPVVDLASADREFPGCFQVKIPCGESAPDLTAAAAQFPDLRGAEIVGPQRGYSGPHDHPTSVRYPVRLTAGRSLRRYRSSNVLMPAVGGSELSMHPILVWWAVLYSLSMLARYEPRAWTTLIEIDSSIVATEIEYVLDVAIDAVPELISEALNEQGCP